MASAMRERPRVSRRLVRRPGRISTKAVPRTAIRLVRSARIRPTPQKPYEITVRHFHKVGTKKEWVYLTITQTRTGARRNMRLNLEQYESLRKRVGRKRDWSVILAANLTTNPEAVKVLFHETGQSAFQTLTDLLLAS